MDVIYKEFQVAPTLRKYIDCIWKERYEKRIDKEQRSFLVIPDNTVELVFTSNPIQRTFVNSPCNKDSIKEMIEPFVTDGYYCFVYRCNSQTKL